MISRLCIGVPARKNQSIEFDDQDNILIFVGFNLPVSCLRDLHQYWIQKLFIAIRLVYCKLNVSNTGKKFIYVIGYFLIAIAIYTLLRLAKWKIHNKIKQSIEHQKHFKTIPWL